jgi:ATP-dependent Lhr-like helicase
MGSQSDHLCWAHPIVREWFLSRFESPTEPQLAGWPPILAGRNTLISAPTGSGKTLAAFLACIDALVRQALSGGLEDRTQVLYVSPLKALGNDVQKNLDLPLFEIQQLAAAHGYLMPAIRTFVRTGDTPSRERARMLRQPPHILVTTPESLYILLTAARSRETLRHVHTVIVDEIHALVPNKRGAHLALSLERLDSITEQRPNRIGLSATQRPLSLVAEFLAGEANTAGGPYPPAVGECGERPVTVVIPSARPLDLAIELPSTELGPIASNELWEEIYQRLERLALEHRSTLVFVSTRRLVERISHRLAARMGNELVAAHHGSLSRQLRLEAERRLKQGECRILVATASLELGIDIGHVDLVCQIGSPRAISTALQRIGRAGHWRGAIPKGRLFATTRDELVECAAILQAIRQQDLDSLSLPDAPLDILAQQIVAACAADEWNEDELFALVRRAHPYRDLPHQSFDKVVAMLSEGISASRGRLGAYLYRDQVNHRLRARRGSRLAAITSGGAIPETALLNVVALPTETVIGTVDEDFAVESHAGDIMLLGNTSWRIRRVEARTGRVLVEDAHGQPPTIPFWRGEAPARTFELSSQVAQVRELIDSMCHPERSEGSRHGANPGERSFFFGQQSILPELPRDTSMDVDVEKSPGAPFKPSVGLSGEVAALATIDIDADSLRQLTAYIAEGRAILGAVPTQRCVIAERFFDEGGGMQLVIHAPFGARINRAWGLALRKRFCRSFNFELQASATDDGINIALAEQHSFPLADVFHFLQPETVEDVLQQAVLTGSPLFATRFRWDASRSLALLRFHNGKKIPPYIQRMKSDDLLAAVFPQVAACFENIEGDIPLPDHPLVEEVMKDVMHEAMDIDGLRRVLEGIRDGSIRTVAVDTPVPSPFAHEILNANPYAFLDDAPLEERRARAVQLRRTLPASVLEEAGRLDPAAIAQVIEESRPDLRDADDLHDLLQTLILFPAPPNGPPVRSEGFQQGSDLSEGSTHSNQRSILAGGPHPPSVGEGGDSPAGWMSTLVESRRAVFASVQGRRFWVASEKAKDFTSIYVDVSFSPQPPELAPAVSAPSRESLLDRALLAWMQHLGPVTAQELGAIFCIEQASLTLAAINASLLRLEATGAILRGHFRQPAGELEWCDRRLLARIHRLTVATLRKQIEPVTAAQFMHWLLRWQHVAPGTALRGEHGLQQALRELQGFEIPANAWERDILARRVDGYDPAWLDRLCLMGVAGWGRLSPHPATLADQDSTQRPRRIVPTAVAPITFFLREECAWMQPRSREEIAERGFSDCAQRVLDALRRRGASFLAELQRITALQRAEVERGLWELVAAGLVTADAFDNLRTLITRTRLTSITRARRAHAAGRWSLLWPEDDAAHEIAAESAASRALTDERVEATCWMLLGRYGVVFRELLARETNLPRWRELQWAFRRLEARGEVRGGRFVSGFVGEQFALPEAVESLRELCKLPPSSELITISAADPLNLVGILVPGELPGERVPAFASRTVSFRAGVYVADPGAPLREAILRNAQSLSQSGKQADLTGS